MSGSILECHYYNDCSKLALAHKLEWQLKRYSEILQTFASVCHAKNVNKISDCTGVPSLVYGSSTPKNPVEHSTVKYDIFYVSSSILIIK